jgi:hypothetical protein
MAENGKTIKFCIALTWGLFTASFMIWLFFEKMVFENYFKKTWEYGVLALVLVGTAILASSLSKILPNKALAVIIFACIEIAAVLWFLIMYDLPVIPNNAGCGGVYCSAAGQLAMIVIHVSVLPAVLVEWTRRSDGGYDDVKASSNDRAGVDIFPFMALVIAGAVLLITGIVSSASYYWSVLVAFIAMGTMGVSFLLLFWKIHARKPIDARGTPDTNLFFRDLFVVLLIGVPGFAMLSRDTYEFSLLLYFGASVVIFSVAYHVIARLKDDKIALFTLEGIVLAFDAVAISIFYYVNVPTVNVVLPIGLPEFVIGFATGYLWTRVYHVARGITYPKAFAKPAIVDNMRNFTNKLVTSLFLFAIVAFTAVNLDPSAPDVISIVYPVGLALSILGLILWTISAWKLKK